MFKIYVRRIERLFPWLQENSNFSMKTSIFLDSFQAHTPKNNKSYGQKNGSKNCFTNLQKKEQNNFLDINTKLETKVDT